MMATAAGKVIQGKPDWLKELTFIYRPVVLAKGERWCVQCGETMFVGDACPRCNGRQWIDPQRVLQPGEFVMG
jgi:hypothetical protein